MRNDGGLHARTPRTGRSSGFFPNSLRAIFRSASNLASTVRSAGSSVATTISTAEDERQREQVQWAGFDKLELGPADFRHVLLLTYVNGFQVWDVEEADDVRELVSKRDGLVAFLRVQPEPDIRISDGFKAARPLLLVVTGDATNCSSTGVSGGLANGYSGVVGSPPSTGGNQFIPTVVKFYSVRNHSYVNTLRFRSAIYALRCSPRVVVVALVSQLYCFDAATLQSTFSVLTYPSSTPNIGYGAVAVGPRWLAYAANQPLISNTGRVSPQHLTPSPGVSPSTSPANGNLVAQIAKLSSQHIVAGIVTLGDMGYKTFSLYCPELLPDGASSPVPGSPSLKNNCNGLTTHPHEPEHAGTVIVRDLLNKAVVAQFRAHGSPLSALSFDPSGTLLVTASVHGRSVNVFRIIPASNGSGANSNAFDANASHVHLYKLSRGVTRAVIQDITFSEDSHWIVVSSSRGTSHLFAISPFGGPVGPYTHGTALVDKAVGTMVSMTAVPWWSNMDPVKSSQQASLPPPRTVNLSVVGRIKNGNGGWRGAVSGAAAAASRRSSGSAGGVAVVFHDGGGQNLEAELRQSSLKEQLWVLSPSGHLLRYALCPSVGIEGSFSNNIASDVYGGSKETFYLRVVVEPLQKWDVCRRPNWVEREEKIENATVSAPAQDEVSMAGTPRYKNKRSMGRCFGNERTGKEEMLPEEMHQWCLSNAEVQMHHSRAPIWAKPQVCFHVFTGAVNNGTLEKADIGGETEIEIVQTRVVEVKKKDLVPVFDRLKNVQCAEISRDRELPSNYGLNSSGLHLQLLRDDGIQDGFIGSTIGVVQIQRSSSGSSCGSEGSLYTPANVGMNGFHYSYQDSMQDGLPHYPDPSTSFLHQTQQNQLLPDKAKLQSVDLPGSDSINVKKNIPADSVIGSPPMEIPKLKCPDVYGMAPIIGGGSGVNSPAGMESSPERVMLSTGDNPNTNAENRTLFACKARIDVGSSSHVYIARNASLNGPGSAVVSNRNSWDAPAVEGADLHSIQPQFHGNLNQASGRSPNGILNHVGIQQDYDPAAEDVESVDANSKSEDFEGGEQGEDAWEGAMFPFTEDC